MHNMNFIHIIHAKKAVNQLTEMLDDKNNENNFILGTNMDDIIRMMRKSNALSFLSKIKEHFAYQSCTDKNFVKEPSSFTKNDYMGFEDSFEVYMLNCTSDVEKDVIDLVFIQLKNYLDLSMNGNPLTSYFL